MNDRNLNGDKNYNEDPNNPYIYDPNDPFNQISDEDLETISFVYFIVFLILAAFNIYLFVRCLTKRAASKGLEEQMKHKRI